MIEQPAATPAGTSLRTCLAGSIAAGTAGLAGLGATSATAASTVPAATPPPRAQNQSTMLGVPFEPFDEVRVGIIGLGNRGMGLLPLFDAVPGVRITAIADVRRERVRGA